MELSLFYLSDFTDELYNIWFKRIPEEKQNKIIRFKNPDDRRRSVCGYMLAANSLSSLLGIAPESVVLSYSPEGQPLYDGAFVSIAHSDNLVVSAASLKRIGVDCEKIKPVNLKIADRVCTEKEKEYVFEIGDDSEKSKRLIAVFTRKEAYGKMLGKGIAYNMNDTEITDFKTEIINDYYVTVVEE